MYLTWRKHALLRSAQKYNGVVTDYVIGRGTKGRTNYALQITYTNNKGIEKRFVTSATSSSPECAIGESVAVFEKIDGTEPDVLIFAYLYLHYWIWFCAGITVLGCLLAPGLLRNLY